MEHWLACRQSPNKLRADGGSKYCWRQHNNILSSTSNLTIHKGSQFPRVFCAQNCQRSFIKKKKREKKRRHSFKKNQNRKGREMSVASAMTRKNQKQKKNKETKNLPQGRPCWAGVGRCKTVHDSRSETVCRPTLAIKGVTACCFTIRHGAGRRWSWKREMKKRKKEYWIKNENYLSNTFGNTW